MYHSSKKKKKKMKGGRDSLKMKKKGY